METAQDTVGLCANSVTATYGPDRRVRGPTWTSGGVPRPPGILNHSPLARASVAGLQELLSETWFPELLQTEQ